MNLSTSVSSFPKDEMTTGFAPTDFTDLIGDEQPSFSSSSSQPDVWSQFWRVVDILLAIIIIINNGLVIISFLSSRMVREVMNAFLFSMAAVDFLHGCVSIPISVGVPRASFYFSTGMSLPTCVFFYNASNILWTIGMYNILFVTLYRFISVIIPLRYENYLTQRNCFIAISTAWAAILFYSYIPTFPIAHDVTVRYIRICSDAFVYGKAYAYTYLYLFLYAPLFTIIILYVIMYGVSRKHSRRIAQLPDLSAGDDESKSNEKRQIIRISKAAKTTFTLSAVYICCWMPNFISMHIIMDCYFGECPSGFDQTSFSMATPVLVFFGFLNSAINPCIYGFRNPVIRSHLKHLFSKCTDFLSTDDGDEGNASSVGNGVNLQSMA